MRRANLKRAWLLALGLLLATNRAALAANIVVDASFGDWTGQPFIADPVGDSGQPRTDLRALYWATNPGDSTAYFMVQRTFSGGNGGQRVVYRLQVDTNCNGSTTEAVDRVVQISYNPTNVAGIATMIVYTGAGLPIAGAGGVWGDAATGSPNGGTRVEFGVPFSDLGLSANQTICFWLTTHQNASQTTADDTSASVQWAPVPALGYPLLFVVVTGVGVYVWRRQEKLGWQHK